MLGVILVRGQDEHDVYGNRRREHVRAEGKSAKREGVECLTAQESSKTYTAVN
jgi:hypothetical protein